MGHAAMFAAVWCILAHEVQGVRARSKCLLLSDENTADYSDEKGILPLTAMCVLYLYSYFLNSSSIHKHTYQINYPS